MWMRTSHLWGDLEKKFHFVKINKRVIIFFLFHSETIFHFKKNYLKIEIVYVRILNYTFLAA